jgi:hypothetical protein
MEASPVERSLVAIPSAVKDSNRREELEAYLENIPTDISRLASIEKS